MFAYFRYQLIGMLLAFVIIVVAVAAVISLSSDYRQWRLRQQSTDEWFSWASIEYVREDRNGRGGLGSLVMVSTSTISRPVELRFQDILYCERVPGLIASARADDSQADIGELLVFVSQNPDTSSFAAQAREQRRIEWLYNADYPYGHDCVVRSTITGVVDTVTKRAQVESPIFRVERRQ